MKTIRKYPLKYCFATYNIKKELSTLSGAGLFQLNGGNLLQ